MRGSLRYSENYEGNTESREKTEKRNPEKTESNFFKRVGEKLLLLAGLALAAPNCGGSGSKAGDADTETTEEVEEVDGYHDIDAIDDLLDNRENDSVETNLDNAEADSEETDSSESETVDAVDDEEVIPPNCPSPTEPPAVPELNNMFLNVANGTFSTDGGELSADSELALSFTTDGNPLACPSGNGGFEIVCEGAERNVSGQHYLKIGPNNWTAQQSVPFESAGCPPLAEPTYLLTASEMSDTEVLNNINYILSGGSVVQSVAYFTLNQLNGFSVMMNGSPVSSPISFPSVGPYGVYYNFFGGSGSIDIRSISGRGEESTRTLSGGISAHSSKVLWVNAINSSQDPNYRLLFNARYTLYNCFRCNDGSGLIYDVVIPPTVLGIAENSECGKMGNPVNLTFTLIESVVSEHRDYFSAVIGGVTYPTLYNAEGATATYTYDGSGSPNFTYRIIFTLPPYLRRGQIDIDNRWHVTFTPSRAHPCGGSSSSSEAYVYVNVIDYDYEWYNLCKDGAGCTGY